MADPLYSTPIPSPQNVAGDACLEAIWASYQFYHEVEYRQAHDKYCQWYYEVAEQNRRELEQMRHDINILGWFFRR